MYQVTDTDPAVEFDVNQFERQIATFVKNNNITTQASWDSLITSLSTLAQMLMIGRALLRCVRILPPRP